MIIGYTTLSVGCLFFFIASLPEIIDSVIQKERFGEGNHILNDKASGIFNGFVAFGAIIAPILGGFLSDSIGYQSSNDSMAIASSSYTIIFGFIFIFTRKPKYYNLGSVMSLDDSYIIKDSIDRKDG